MIAAGNALVMSPHSQAVFHHILESASSELAFVLVTGERPATDEVIFSFDAGSETQTADLQVAQLVFGADADLRLVHSAANENVTWLKLWKFMVAI